MPPPAVDGVILPLAYQNVDKVKSSDLTRFLGSMKREVQRLYK